MKHLQGELVLITGGGQGLGRLLALRFANQGARLVLLDLNVDTVQEVAEEIISRGGEAAAYACDVSDRAMVYAVAAQIKREHGTVSVLVNNAGIVSGRPFLEVPDGLAQKEVEVNTISHFWLGKAFLPAMFEHDHGHLVTIASAAGTGGVAGLASYCASKFGAFGFAESMRQEIRKQGKTGVHTTLVCPYYINTGMFDGVKTRFPWLLPILEPDYVADKILAAVQSDQAVLVMPRILYAVPILRGILPTALFDWVSDFLGFSSSMDDFRGHDKRE